MQENFPKEKQTITTQNKSSEKQNDKVILDPLKKSSESAEEVRSKSLSPQTQEQKSVVLNALAMAFGTMASRSLGLLRESAFAALFDKQVTDAFGVAFRLPNLFRRLLGEGSLSVSFIPVFIEARHHDGLSAKSEINQEFRAKNLINSFYTLLLICLACLTTLGIVFAEPILKAWLNEAYIADSAKFALTLRMTQIMFGFIFFVSNFAFYMGILNALGSYGLAALAPTLWNVAMIIATLLPMNWFASPGDGLALGVLVGGLLQMGILIPRLFKLGYLPRLSRKLISPDVIRVLKNMVPGLMGMGLLQFTTLINLNFLSRLNEGTISFVNYVDRLIELPLSLISVSLGTALLPTLSLMWSRGEKQKMSETSHFYLRLNLYTSIPAAFGLMALSYPIVELLFVRGRFSEGDALVTAKILSAYAWIMIFTSCVRVLTPAYYAIKNTWYPALISGVCLVFHIGLAPVLMQKYEVIGLMSSTVASAALNFLLLLFAYPKLIAKFDFLKLGLQVFKFLFAGLGLYLICQSAYPVLREFFSLSFLGKTGSLTSAILIALFYYVLISKVFRFEEFESVFGTLAKKVKSKFSKLLKTGPF